MNKDFTVQELQFIGSLINSISFKPGQSQQLATAENIIGKINKILPKPEDEKTKTVQKEK